MGDYMTKRYPKVIANNEGVDGWPLAGVAESREKRRAKPFGKGVIMNDIHGNPIQAKTHGQHELIKAIDEFDIIFINGPAGTGKTFLSTIKAIDYIENRPDSSIKKLIITRPAVEAGENLGFMPGDLTEKFDHYMAPIYDAIAKVKRKVKPQPVVAGHGSGHTTGAVAHQPPPKPVSTSFYSLQEYGDFGKKVEISPMAFMRGTNFENAFVILDEAQNLTKTQMKLFLTRMCEGSKLVICGDVSQTDLKSLSNSGFGHAQTLLSGVEGIGIVNMTYNDIVRHKLVKDILMKYDKESYRDHTISNRD